MERTRVGMRAALELGRWRFPAPLGYLNAPKWSGKSLVRDPERAAFVKQVFEDFATGRFTKQQVLARNGYYAYYHCQRQCRAVNVSKTKLEGLFAEELGLLQPTPGYMRLVKDRVLYVWQQRTSEVNDRATDAQRRAKIDRQKLDRRGGALLYPQTVGLTRDDRQWHRRREEFMVTQIRHLAAAVLQHDL